MRTGPFTDPDRLWTMVNQVVGDDPGIAATAVGHLLDGRTADDWARRDMANMRDVVCFGQHEFLTISPKENVSVFKAIRAARKDDIPPGLFADVRSVAARDVSEVVYPSGSTPPIAQLATSSTLLEVRTCQGCSHWLHVFPDMTNMKNLEWAAANYVKNWGAGSQ